MKVLLSAALALGVLAVLVPEVHAIESRPVLKTYFESGDKPTEQQFSTLIDSYIHRTEDGISLYAIGTNSSTGDAARKTDNDIIDDTLSYVAVANPGTPIPAMAPEFAGLHGYLPLQLVDTGGQTHFGYFQLSMDPESGASTTGIHVDYFVFEPSPNTAIVAEAVPERRRWAW
jgi:hypothetical protein